MHVTAELFPGDFLDQMPRSGSPEKLGSAEEETDPCSLFAATAVAPKQKLSWYNADPQPLQ